MTTLPPPPPPVGTGKKKDGKSKWSHKAKLYDLFNNSDWISIRALLPEASEEQLKYRITDRDEDTVLLMATDMRTPSDIIELLLWRRANQMSQKELDEELFMIVTTTTPDNPLKEYVATALLEMGGNPNAKPIPCMKNDASAVTAMHWMFSKHTTVSLLQAMILHGGNPNLVTTDGSTPLTEAVLVAPADVILALLDAGADPNRGHINYMSALALALKAFRPLKIIHALCQYGAEISTAFIAQLSGNELVVRPALRLVECEPQLRDYAILLRNPPPPSKLFVAQLACEHCQKKPPPDVKFSKCVGCGVAVYCSEKCAKEQWAMAHKMECAILNTREKPIQKLATWQWHLSDAIQSIRIPLRDDDVVVVDRRHRRSDQEVDI